MNTLLEDLRYGWRMLWTKPAFSLAAILTLALGIGANAAIFSVLNGMLLKPLPFVDGERLVQVYNSYPKMGLLYAGSSIPDYIDRRGQAPALADLALYTDTSFNLASGGGAQRVVGIKATPSLFSTLQVQPAMGRAFSEDEAIVGHDKVAVLSYAAWRDQFGAASDILSRDVRLNGENFKVVGVLPEGFGFPNRNVGIYVPFAFSDKDKSDDERGHEYSDSIGRLAPGASIEQLNAQMDAIVQHNADRLSGAPGVSASDIAFYREGNFTGRARSLRDQWVGDTRNVLWMLQAVVGLVLLIAAANVANLMLTRAASRQRELTVRTALGASRWRLARQLLVESLLLATTGGAVGIALAYAGLAAMRAIGLAQNQLSSQVGIDAPVLGFTLLISLGTGLLFGLFPVFQQWQSGWNALKEGGRGNVGGRAAAGTRNVLVVTQLAVAVTLLVGAGLMIRSILRSEQQDPGFRSEGLLSVRIDLPMSRYAADATKAGFFERALGELRTLPGVDSASFVTDLPFSDSDSTSSYKVVGQETPSGQPGPHGHIRIVDEDYFRSMSIPVLAGRTFTAADVSGSEPVVVIDQLLRDKYFPGKDPIGQQLDLGFVNRKFTIVGVVAPVKIRRLTDQVKKESYFISFRQVPASSGFLLLHANGKQAGLADAIRAAVLKADPDQAVYDIRTLDARIADSLREPRATTSLLLVFAGVALALAAVGIYGVLAFAVANRTGEIGVRVAIGAQRGDIYRLVLGQGARIAAVGLALGVVGALALSRFIESALFGVSARDPLTFVAVIATLSAVALLACWLPARRAAAIDPLVAIRYE